MIPSCPVCDKELGPAEVTLNQKYHYDCNKCATCELGPLTYEIMEAWLEGKGTREHSGCRDKRLERELLSKEVTITQAHLDFLNRIRLMAWVDEDATSDIASESQSTEQQFRALKIHERKIDDMYKFLSKYQTFAALTSICIAQKKDAQLKKASSDYRDKTQYEKEIERTKTRTEEARKIQLQKEREDPKLRNRRKAVEGMMKAYNMTMEQVEAMMKEQGR